MKTLSKLFWITCLIGCFALVATEVPAFAKTSCGTGGQVGSFSRSAGGGTYLIKVPSGYSSSTAMPLLIALHGDEGDPSLATYMIFDSFFATPGAYILVTPKASKANQWYHPSYINEHKSFVNAVISDVLGSYNIDLDRVWMAGLSGGSAFLSTYAIDRQDIVAAAMFFKGGGNSSYYAAPAGSCKFPARFIIGTNDFLLQNAQVTYSFLQGKGHQVIASWDIGELQGISHAEAMNDPAWLAAYDKAWTWLKTKTMCGTTTPATCGSPTMDGGTPDTGTDAGVDTNPTDIGTDKGTDIGTDTGTDVGVDSGSGDKTAPSVAITAPSALAQVVSPVSVSVAAQDNVGVVRVELWVGTSKLDQKQTAPYQFSVALASGNQKLVAKAFDAAGNLGQASVTVVVNGGTLPPDSSLDSAQFDSGNDAQQPNFDSGPVVNGGFAAPCDAPSDCQSNLCAKDPSTMTNYCTRSCDAVQNPCPFGATCQAVNGDPNFSVCALDHGSTNQDAGGNPSQTYDGSTNGINVMSGGCSVGGEAQFASFVSLFILVFGAAWITTLYRRKRSS